MFRFRRRPASRRRNPRPPCAAGRASRARRRVPTRCSRRSFSFARTRLREGDDPRDRGRRGREHRHLLRILRRQAASRRSASTDTCWRWPTGCATPSRDCTSAAGRTGRRARRPAGRAIGADAAWGALRAGTAGVAAHRLPSALRRVCRAVARRARARGRSATAARLDGLRADGAHDLLRRAFAGVADAQPAFDIAAARRTAGRAARLSGGGRPVTDPRGNA